MTGILRKVFDIERHELSRALLMFLYAFLLLSAYLILKPVRNSLFLDRFGADQLIYMYMMIAATATPIAWLYGWTAARTTLPRLVGGTTIILVVNMAIFWYLIGQQFSWLIYVFYIWVSLFGVFTTSQFWLLANYVFDAREAKRLFPFIGAGAITGGIAGSFLTSQLAKLIGTENLLWLCMAFMLACFGILLVVWRMRQGDDPKKAKGKKKSKDLSGMLPIIMGSRHLKLLAITISITVIVSTLVDFQFNKVVKDSFDNKDELTAFFGSFFLWLSIASLVLQLVLSSRVLRRFGIGAAIMFLPIGLLLGSTAILLWPVLMSAVAVKISDGAFRYSINKTGMELLYLPIPVAIKGRAKAFMDVVGDRLARGFGGALLYLVNDILAWPVQWISFLSAVLIAGWISVAVMLKREYSRTFRAALDTRAINAEEIQVQLQDAATLEAITAAMAGNDRRQILFALELIADEKDNRLAKPLVRLLSHKSDEVRSTALSRLTDLENTDLSRDVELLLKDPTGDVRALAIRYLCLHTSDNPEKLLTQFLDSDDLLLVSAAARCALEIADSTDGARLLTDKHFERVLSSPETENQLAREQLAVALKYIRPGDPLTKVASRFLDDESIRVRQAALVSASHLKRRDLLPQILISLGLPSLRAVASEALLAYGPAILGTLRDTMLDTTRPAPVRLRIPKVISRMDTNEAAELLFAQVHIDEALLKYVVIKGLNRARRRMGELTLDTGRIRQLIKNETKSYYRLSTIAAVLATADNPSRAELFLRRAVSDGQARQLDQIFRAAGLIYPINDMYFAYRGAISSTRNTRANAIEFLDTVWELQEKEQLFPILERRSNLPEIGRKLFGLSRLSRSEAIGTLMNGNDNWLAACAVNLVAVEQLGEHRETVTRLTQSQHQVLSETARTAADRLKA